jgi:hypothetical protein
MLAHRNRDQHGGMKMAKMGGKKGGKSVARENLIVASKIKDVVRGAGCQSSGDLVDAISGKVHEMVSAAVTRAKGNGRATVRPYDL